MQHVCSIPLEAKRCTACRGGEQLRWPVRFRWDAPAPQPRGKEKASLRPGHNAVQHALGNHTHGRVVHLRKCNRYLQMCTRSDEQRLAWQHVFLHVIALQRHGHPLLCRASQEERHAQPRAVPRKQGIKKQ